VPEAVGKVTVDLAEFLVTVVDRLPEMGFGLVEESQVAVSAADRRGQNGLDVGLRCTNLARR
jgi:hypothetical protein